MQEQLTFSPSERLPITHNLRLAYVLSLVVALLVSVASIIGLLYPATIYPTEELRHSFVANDVVNLFIVLPILLGAMWQAQRGSLIGLLFWPGALFIMFYNSVAYVFGLPVNVAFLLNLLVFSLSAYTTVGLVASIDGKAVQQALSGVVPERVGGVVLAGFGIVFFLRNLGVFAGAFMDGTPIATGELATLVADFAIMPAWIIGGVLLWRRHALGYVTGVGLLFQASMLFVAVILVVLLQPLLTAAPLAVGDVIVLSLMGLVSFVPFALFIRGVMAKRR